MDLAVKQMIEALELAPHPEGGYFRETWRSSIKLAADSLPATIQGEREAGSLIYFLLPTGSQSRWHRVKTDELWIFHVGDPLELNINTTPTHDTHLRTYVLGQDHCYQAWVPGGDWQEAKPRTGSWGYSLVSCVVIPGFDFSDFEMI